MPNEYINKVVLDGVVKIDLSADDIKPENLDAGIKAHDKTGAPIVGTSTKDSDTSQDTAEAAEILLGKTSHVKGQKVTGTMPNNGSKALDIADKGTPVTIPAGYHDGGGKAQIAAAEAAKLIPDNIREGITILGVEGTMSGTEDARPQAKSVTPSFAAQEVLPDSGYNYLSSVTVAAIPVTYTDNEAGGQTLKIGA